jgi:hypothetical protein
VTEYSRVDLGSRKDPFASDDDNYDINRAILATSWLQTQRARVRVLALSDFASSSGPGAGSTQTHAAS